MASTNPVINAVKTAVSKIPKRINPAHRRKPSPIPLRPLEPDRFRPPRGQKQVFLPNFTLTLLRPSPHQPANYASFLTPLWLNKLDLKDYLYHLYSVETLSVRSYIQHGRTRRSDTTGQLYREPQQKKMTIEMKPGDNFVWPETPEDLEPWNVGRRDATEKQNEELKEGKEKRSKQGQVLGEVGKAERRGFAERARALLEGRARWRPGWEEAGTGMVPLGGEARPSASV